MTEKPKHMLLNPDPHARYGGWVISCICGWAYWHKRRKVIDAAGERHMAKNA